MADYRLSPRQETLYTDRCDLYRPVHDRDPATGMATGIVQILAERGVPCKVRFTPNVDDVTPAGRAKRDNVFTTDVFHLPTGVEVGAGWWALMTTPGSPTRGQVYKMLGAPQHVPGAGRRDVNVQMLMASQDEKPPQTLAAAAAALEAA